MMNRLARKFCILFTILWCFQWSTTMVIDLGIAACPNSIYDHLMIKYYQDDCQNSIIVWGFRAGIADRLVGLISAFYWALLTNRGFRIMTDAYGITSFDYAFNPNMPYNWTVKYESFYAKNRRKIARLERIWMINNDTMATMIYKHSNLSEVPNIHTRSIEIFSNRGRIKDLFDNPYHGSTLRNYGLSPETAFACAYQYLFHLNDHTKAIVEKYYGIHQYYKPNVLKIAIHVRVGDHVFEGNESSNSIEPWHQSFFSCAEDIEKSRKLFSNQEVVWFLMTESLTLRKSAKNKYKDKLITDTHSEPIHSDCLRHYSHMNKKKRNDYFKAVRSCNRESILSSSMQQAAADMHIFSLADYHIITKDSGFGKVAAISKITKSHKIYQLCSTDGIDCIENCSLDQPYTPFDKLSAEWAGL